MSLQSFGRPTRASATQALKAHVDVLKGTPLRLAVSKALKAAPKLGGQERHFVACAARELSRHMRRLDAVAKQAGWSSRTLHLVEDQAILRYALWRILDCNANVSTALSEVALPGPIRPRSLPDSVIEKALRGDLTLPLPDDDVDRLATLHSFPTWLTHALATVTPSGELDAVLAALNREPQLTFRARPPQSRDGLVSALQAEGIAAEASLHSESALQLTDEKRSVFETRYFKNGQLLTMDLGSQLIVEFAQVAHGMTVADACAGAGGKTIALADAVGASGRVFAADASSKRLAEAKKRCHQLRLVNVSFPAVLRVDLADVVLVDAPCSGVGSLSREPDQKWKLDQKKVLNFQKTQVALVKELASKMKTGARLVYATCSLLDLENERVVEAVGSATFVHQRSMRVWPHRMRSGGFFAACFQKLR
jgi:16S rRNA (cytosine967-C5)-methyltransferase